jgi:TorA maturation chaperone TorD
MNQEFADQIIEVNESRATFARMLASIYLYELTDEQIESFAHLAYPDDGSRIAHAYATITEYLRHRNKATRQTLAADYAHTFLGAGVYDQILAPPYESVFTSKQRLLMQVARDGALMYYHSEGLGLPEDNTTPEDHLGFELQFSADLTERSTEALRRGDDKRYSELVEKQRSFLRYHQENWLPAFCDAVDEFCQTDFYHGIAELTRAYLETERAFLDEVAGELGLPEEEVELRPAWADEDEKADEKAAIAAGLYDPGRASGK